MNKAWLASLLALSVAVMAQPADDVDKPAPETAPAAEGNEQGNVPAEPPDLSPEAGAEAGSASGEARSSGGDVTEEPGDFQPAEEISEDFPIPLPADI